MSWKKVSKKINWQVAKLHRTMGVGLKRETETNSSMNVFYIYIVIVIVISCVTKSDTVYATF